MNLGDIMAYGPKSNPGLGEVVAFREDGVILLEDRPLHWGVRRLPFQPTELRPASPKQVKQFHRENRPAGNHT